MNRLGIETGLDLRAQTKSFLHQHFGKSGLYFYWIARGIDDRLVRPDRIRKSIGAENTFSVDLLTFDAAQDALLPIVDKVWRHCEGTGARGRTVTLKVKYTDFQQVTRSRSLAAPLLPIRIPMAKYVAPNHNPLEMLPDRVRAGP